MKKRWLSFILALALIMTSSVSALAFEGEEGADFDGSKRSPNEVAALSLATEEEDMMNPDSLMIPVLMPVLDNSGEAYKLLNYVNQKREAKGIAPLKWDSNLEKYAGIRATELIFDYSHMRPSGQSWYSIDPTVLHGENRGRGAVTADEAIEGWMKMNQASANILDPDFKSMGASLRISDGDGHKYYWTIEFSVNDGNAKYLTNGDIKAVDQVITVKGKEADRQIRNFVLRLYNKVLGRPGDLNGLAGWTTLLGTHLATGAETAYGFFFSDEFKNKNTTDEEYLTTLYQTILNRDPDGGGMEAWKKLLEGGLSRTYAFRGLCESQEFTNLCKSYGIERGNVALTEPRDQNSGVTLFVSRLYDYVLDRKADVKGLNDWTNLILTGEATPESVAYGIIFSDEFKNKQTSNGDFIDILYRVFMDRESDPSGYNAWKRLLDNGKSREEVFYGFSKSPEFGDILRSFGL